MIDHVSVRSWNQLHGAFSWILPRDWRLSNPGDKARKLGRVLQLNSPDELYLSLISHWQEPDSVVIDGREPSILQRTGPVGLRDRGLVERMMYLDLVTYLPDDILCKVDRAAMSVSLETRVPYLDQRVVEFAWTLPIEYRVEGGVGKRILRNLLARYVPKNVFERPKMGFGIPIQDWLRGPLRDWAESLLAETRLRAEGYFDPIPVRRVWDEHVRGGRDWGYLLWDVLMFQAWLNESKRPA